MSNYLQVSAEVFNLWSIIKHNWINCVVCFDMKRSWKTSPSFLQSCLCWSCTLYEGCFYICAHRTRKNELNAASYRPSRWSLIEWKFFNHVNKAPSCSIRFFFLIYNITQNNMYILIFEPVHEIIVLFVLRKLILQTRMRSHPVGQDVWFLIEPFVYFHTSCVRTAKILVRLITRDYHIQ